MKEKTEITTVAPVCLDWPTSPFLKTCLHYVSPLVISLITCWLLMLRDDDIIKPFSLDSMRFGMTGFYLLIVFCFCFLLLTIASFRITKFYLSRQAANWTALLDASKAAIKLSEAYLDGRGVIKSMQTAESHYLTAIAGYSRVARESTCTRDCYSCAEALESLATPEGFMSGSPKKFGDLRLVALAYLRSALLGNTRAQMKVAHLYQDGVGFGKNHSEAYAWFNICAAGGDFGAERMRESLARGMSQAYIHIAQKRSHELLAMVKSKA